MSTPMPSPEPIVNLKSTVTKTMAAAHMAAQYLMVVPVPGHAGRWTPMNELVFLTTPQLTWTVKQVTPTELILIIKIIN